jgi:hypothetical protein
MKWIGLLLLISGFVSCRSLSVSDQATLSRPVFQFQATGPKVYECGLTGQLEPGRSSTNNVAAGGCAFCH